MSFQAFQTCPYTPFPRDKKKALAPSEALGPLSYLGGSLGLSGLRLRRSFLLRETLWPPAEEIFLIFYSHPTVKRTPLPLARVPVFLCIAARKYSRLLVKCSSFLRKYSRLLVKCSSFKRKYSRLLVKCSSFLRKYSRLLVKCSSCLRKYSRLLVKCSSLRVCVSLRRFS